MVVLGRGDEITVILSRLIKKVLAQVIRHVDLVLTKVSMIPVHIDMNNLLGPVLGERAAGQVETISLEGLIRILV
jgi:hypothetical protein